MVLFKVAAHTILWSKGADQIKTYSLWVDNVNNEGILNVRPPARDDS